MKTKEKLSKLHGELALTAEVFKEDNIFIAKCKELTVTSQGKNAAEALSNLEEAIELYLEDEELEKTIVLPLKFHFSIA